MARHRVLRRIRSHRRYRQASDIFTRIVSNFNRVFSRPFALLLVVLSAVLAISETSAPNNSLLTQGLAKFGSNSITQFLAQHKVQTIAFLSYAGAVTSSAPQRSLITYLLVAAAIAYLLPEATNWEYLVQSVLLFLFIGMRRSSDRIIIVIAAIAAYAIGWIAIPTATQRQAN